MNGLKRPGELFADCPDFEIRQVANGWILYANDYFNDGPRTRDCYVFTNAKALGEFIAKHATTREERAKKPVG